MTQKRSFEYKSNDSTADLNNWMLSFFEPGVLHGFYPEFSGLNLLFRHDQKQIHREVDYEGVLSSGTGVILSKQGVVIKETSQISLSIDTNEYSANPRIDLIVCDHSYNLIEGGVEAIYMVIKGTPGENPVKPSVINENTQVIIGSLYIEAGASDLVTSAYFDREISSLKIYNLELVQGVDFVLGDVTVSGLKCWLVNGKLRIVGEVTANTSGTALLTFKKTMPDGKFISISDTSGTLASEVMKITSNVLSMSTGAVGKKIMFNNEIIL